MRRNMRFPVPLKDSNAAGVAKRDTLEFFVFNPGWHKPVELDDDPVVGGLVSSHDDGSRSSQMRLMRYSRQGLLARRKTPGGFEYEITMKGEDRLFYLWKKLGDTKTNGMLTSDEAERSTQLLNLKKEILEKRLRRLSDF